MAIITFLTVTKYPCHRLSQLCFVVTILSFPRSWHYHRILNMGSTTGATSDAEIAYLFRAPELVPVFSKVFLVHFVQWHVFTFLVSCCGVCYDFRVNTMFDSSWLLFCRDWDSYSTRFPYKIIILSFNSNTTGATRGAGNSFSYLEFSVGFGLSNL
jgi:hypothetical protein